MSLLPRYAAVRLSFVQAARTTFLRNYAHLTETKRDCAVAEDLLLQMKANRAYSSAGNRRRSRYEAYSFSHWAHHPRAGWGRRRFGSNSAWANDGSRNDGSDDDGKLRFEGGNHNKRDRKSKRLNSSHIPL